MVQVGGVGNRTNNLFDLKKAVSKKYINSNGNEATSLSPTPENTLNHSDYVSIESNVNYTFTCTTSQNYSLENTIALCWFDENKNILSRNTMNVRGNINNYSITALSPSTAKYLIVNFIAYVDDAVFYLNEGTTTVFEPYGYKVPVVISGKNLFDGTLGQGSFNSNDGTDFSSNNTVRTDYIKVKPNTTYTISINDNSDIGIRYVGYYKENEFSYNTLNIQKSTTITIPTGVVSIRVVFRRETTSKLLISDVDTSKIQIEYGNTITSVEEYIEPTTTNIYLDEPIGENESISLSDTNTNIPTIRGTNVLTVDTTVQPSKVYVKARKESSYETIMRERYEEAQAQLDALESGGE